MSKPLDLEVIRKELIEKYWKEQKYDEKKQIKRDYTIEEILELFEERLKSAVQGLLSEIEKKVSPYYSKSTAVITVENVEEIIKKWFPGVFEEEWEDEQTKTA
ncbi:MAG: hypothetical protein DRP12_00265 [Candidatus Aenigmatarchaeota archaeon]|nr:MAG: hypothetical protein DRP12_00265 [Candidatus Aenigmarchaeota archaeon]